MTINWGDCLQLMNKEANIKEVSKLYEYNLNLGNLLFINREAIYKKA